MQLLPPPARRAVSALVIVPLLLLGACTTGDGDDAPSGASPDASTSVEGPQDRRLRLDHRITRVAGELSKKQRARLERRLGSVVRSYLDPAFLRRYPMAGAGKSFSRFTPGARRLARKDQRLLTGVGLGRLDDVRMKRASAYHSVVAPGGRAVGATTRLVVDVRATRKDRTRTVRYRGRLMMTPTKGGWRVFGYDVSRAGADALRDKSSRKKQDKKGSQDEGRRSGGGKGK